MNQVTFLTKEQIFGSDKLEIFEKRGTKAAITDFSILLGGGVSDEHVDGDNSLEGRTGWYWTKSEDRRSGARVVDFNGSSTFSIIGPRTGGARPVLPFSSIGSIPTNGESGKRARDGVLEVEYGYYPQKAVSRDMQERLEQAYRRGNISKTSNTYTTDSVHYRDMAIRFQPRIHQEYEYNGKKYVRVKENACYAGDNFILSNGVPYRDGNHVWVEVLPVKWLADERAGIMITEKLIFAGVQFNNTCGYDERYFNHKDIKTFMDECWIKDIVQDINIEQNLPTTKVGKLANPYGFNFEGVSEEDIIRGAVQSGVAVFLHGRSSEGKSARVKQLDPDCEVIYLRNATPESLNGKSVYNQETGEMIDVKPTWLRKLEEKCDKEPDKIHIVFFDEITNALHSIQGMAFNIVLDREVNGMWKLPDNARIVAAGNDLSDSLAANELAEPLFNRFAHVYINTTVESWLDWASKPKESYERLNYETPKPETKIHPAIYSYIAYRREKALRTQYNGEKPNADPRKWEMASRVLYATKQPQMLRALVGEDITTDFVNFCKQQVISIEDVINGNYTEEDLKMNISQQYATALGLSAVDENNIEKVRQFVKRLRPEILATFENLWVHGDETRLEKIAEIRLKELSEGENER